MHFFIKLIIRRPKSKRPNDYWELGVSYVLRESYMIIKMKGKIRRLKSFRKEGPFTLSKHIVKGLFN